MKKIIALTLALIMCLCVMTMVVCAAPEGLNSLAIAGSGIPGVSEWNPADINGDMVEQSDSIFTKSITFSAPGSMEFKVIGNDAWDDNWNFGFATQGEEIVLDQKMDLVCGGGSQNMTLTVDQAGDYLITVDLTPLFYGDAATILVADNNPIPQPTTAVPTEPTTGWEDEIEDTNEKYSLAVEVPSSWTTVYVYSWGDNDDSVRPFGEYPGSVMSNRTDNTYELQLDVSVHNLIFSNQEGQKTDDLKIDPSRDIEIVIAADGTARIISSGLIITPPLPEVVFSKYRVVGNADWLGNWDPAFEDGRMIDMGDGLYRKSFADVAPGSYEIKITKDGKWDGAYGDNGENFCFTVSEKTKITVDFVLKDDVGIIEVYGMSIGWEDDEPNPEASDLSVLIPAVILLTCTVALPVVLHKRKNT